MIVEVGSVYVTPGAQEALEGAEQTADEFVLRHANGDWGELGTATWPDRELKEGFRIFSAYTLSTGMKICIFTEDDRSLTAIYLPEETLSVCSPGQWDGRERMDSDVATLELGEVVATPGAIAALAEADQGPREFLDRHLSGDWGELSTEDWEQNDLSLREGSRILSAYTLKTSGKIWIITEADRSVTTILLPEEY